MPIPIDGGGRNSLERLAGYPHKLSSWFHNLYDILKDLPWPLELLAWPFFWIYGYFDLIGDSLIAFSHGYFDVMTFLKGFVDLWGLQELLNAIWHDWGVFTSSPKNYILDKLNEVIQSFGIMITFPGRWVMERIQDYRPESYAWLSDFPKQFTRWAQDNHLWLYNLLFDKESFIIDIIDSFSWEAAYFIRDPKQATKFLSSLWLDLPMGFWSNPAEGIVVWVIDGLLLHWRRVLKPVVSVGESVITEIW